MALEDIPELTKEELNKLISNLGPIPFIERAEIRFSGDCVSLAYVIAKVDGQLYISRDARLVGEDILAEKSVSVVPIHSINQYSTLSINKDEKPKCSCCY